jgi:hypothetical protein
MVLAHAYGAWHTKNITMSRGLIEVKIPSPAQSALLAISLLTRLGESITIWQDDINAQHSNATVTSQYGNVFEIPAYR